MSAIFLIVGAPAVGKSTTAHILAGRFPKSVHIPVDNLRDMVVSGLIYPGEDWSEGLVEQLRLARQVAVHMAITYSQAGFTVAIDDFWDPASRLEEYSELIQLADFHKILLFPAREIALARNLKRSGHDEVIKYISQGIKAVYESLLSDLNRLKTAGWLVLDTSEKDVDSTVELILSQSARG
jgi:predicted kinase